MARDVKNEISEKIKNNKILVFMKGSKDMPGCGFSAATVQCFKTLNVPFETVDVMSDPEIREEVKQYTKWPTIPQVFIGGKFIGGCDITREMFASGELKKAVDAVANH